MNVKWKSKWKKHTSTIHDLIGGGPQGSLIGQLLYIIARDDAADEIPEEDKFKYVDDLSALEAVNIAGKLINYDVLQHVPSDVAVGELFLPSITLKTQQYNDSISSWTVKNKMMLKTIV